ncbi:hypothetical protein GCM10007989_24640 [Devosia pacifica]|uniref:PAS domain S-box-containing protein/diguanylate cyclase (GGDEF)-like protein n=1 Tax=Devosia pacifica TaxID=1335967 RepID=A0A918S7Y4_9HYPH|nr:hypothetical protein GCM10007989_24640 [Devosia pacifica]
MEGVTDHAIYMLDVMGNIRTWNAGAARLKGYCADEVVGQHFSIFLGADAATTGSAQAALTTALANRRFETEGWRYRKDGTRFWAQVLIEPVFGHRGEHVGYAKITRDRTEQKAATDRIQHLAGHDPLTGLPNRTLLIDRLNLALDLCQDVKSQRLAVINLDLNRFKDINDTHGHAVGDKLLQIVADRLRQACAVGGGFGRFGGDEFVGFFEFENADELRQYLSALTERLADRA